MGVENLNYREIGSFSVNGRKEQTILSVIFLLIAGIGSGLQVIINIDNKSNGTKNIFFISYRVDLLMICFAFRFRLQTSCKHKQKKQSD